MHRFIVISPDLLAQSIQSRLPVFSSAHRTAARDQPAFTNPAVPAHPVELRIRLNAGSTTPINSRISCAMPHRYQDQEARVEIDISRTESNVKLETPRPPDDLDSDKAHDRGEPGSREVLQDELYEAGIPLRDLSEHESHQFPGIKRERWW